MNSSKLSYPSGEQQTFREVQRVRPFSKLSNFASPPAQPEVSQGNEGAAKRERDLWSGQSKMVMPFVLFCAYSRDAMNQNATAEGGAGTPAAGRVQQSLAERSAAQPAASNP